MKIWFHVIFAVLLFLLVFSQNVIGAWVAYGRSQCVEDWLEIYQIYQDRTEELVGRYCANSSPGPVVSIQKAAVGLKVYLHTDEKDVYSGFMGRYNFFQEKSAFGGKSFWKSFLIAFALVFTLFDSRKNVKLLLHLHQIFAELQLLLRTVSKSMNFLLPWIYDFMWNQYFSFKSWSNRVNFEFQLRAFLQCFETFFRLWICKDWFHVNSEKGEQKVKNLHTLTKKYFVKSTLFQFLL